MAFLPRRLSQHISHNPKGDGTDEVHVQWFFRLGRGTYVPVSKRKVVVEGVGDPHRRY